MYKYNNKNLIKALLWSLMLFVAVTFLNPLFRFVNLNIHSSVKSAAPFLSILAFTKSKGHCNMIYFILSAVHLQVVNWIVFYTLMLENAEKIFKYQ